ncbi:LuxR family transcriptional regulator [Streptomyces sp. NPDC047000]|uniref:helix-turn-helix transcriptional regulator n=1 Tax=Streptomyces sp. NPDC047000 TaxID=3155474 RepID=UPI0033C94096
MPHGTKTTGDRRPGARASGPALLTEELEHTHTSAGLVLLSGEPWTGKTRLTLELARAARRRSWTVACGRAARNSTARPFHAVVDALDDQLARLAATRPAALARLGAARLNALARVFPALGGPLDGPGDLDVHAVVRALGTLLEHLAGETYGRGLLLVLDDAHRAGPETAELADHLLRHPPRAPLLTVLAFRGGGPAARRLAALAHPEGAARHIVLRPLPRHEAAALLPAGLSPLRRALVLRDAAGVPGLLRVLSDGAEAEDGAAVEGTDGMAAPDGTYGAYGAYGTDGADDAGVPHGPRPPHPPYAPYSSLELTCGPCPLPLSATAPDLGPLSPPARAAALAAAAVGDPFTPEAVAAVTGLGLGEALCAVDELCAEGIAGPDGVSGLFRFRRPVLRSLLHRAAGETYRRAARDLARARPTGGDRADAEVAALLEAAVPPTAREAERLAAWAREAVFTQPARAAWAAARAAQHPDPPPGVRLLHCQALVLCGRPAEALTEYARLWPRTGADGPPEGAPPGTAETPAGTPPRAAAGPETGTAEQWAEAAVWRARALRLLGARAQARRVLRAVLAQDGVTGAAGAAVRAELATLLLESGRPMWRAALSAARRAVRSVPEGDVAAYGRALALLTAAHAAAGAEGTARELAAETAPLLSGLGRAEAAVVVEAWLRLGESAVDTGDPREARRCFQHGLDLALLYGQGNALAPFALALARLGMNSGHRTPVCHARLAAAEFDRLTAFEAADEARDLIETLENPPGTNSAGSGPVPLSAREKEIASLIGPGLTNQQIAERMKISVKTVETHMGRIFKKLGVKSRAQVVLFLSLTDSEEKSPPAPRERPGPGAGPAD